MNTSLHVAEHKGDHCLLGFTTIPTRLSAELSLLYYLPPQEINYKVRLHLILLHLKQMAPEELINFLRRSYTYFGCFFSITPCEKNRICYIFPTSPATQITSLFVVHYVNF